MARSSALASIRSCHLRKIAPRSLAVFARHAGHAAFAASIARRVSSGPILGMVPMTAPSDGLVTSMVSPESASHHAPSI